MSITPRQAAHRFSLAEKKFGQQVEKIARRFVNRASARATSLPHMREGGLDPGAHSLFLPGSPLHGRRISPRSPLDTGPLRIVTGRLKRSILPGGTFLRPEAIERVTQVGFRLRFEKGSRVPYAGEHERNPRFSYIGPASRIEKRNLARDAGREIKNMIVTTLRGG